MLDPIILKIAVPAPLFTALDYLAPHDWSIQQLQPGMRIEVPFRNKKVIGVVLKTDNKSFLAPQKLKYALNIKDESPALDEEILALAQWSASYYHYPIGEVIASCLPKKLRLTTKTRKVRVAENIEATSSATGIILNADQQNTIANISHTFDEFQVHLIQGVTGSGKTEIYLRLIEKIITLGDQVLVLVPEIGLTPQTLQRFKERFNVVIAVLHSNLSDKERLEAWLNAKQGIAKIIVGTRSAIFTSIPKLKLIILDEEHDPSYKQQDSFRYHARDVAIIRAQQKKIPVILGSATPSLESLHNVNEKKFHLHTLSQRAGMAQLPSFKIIDIRNQSLNQGLSALLLAAIKKHLVNGGQILLFINRRGFAPVIMCHACGWCATCKHCDSRLVFHKKENQLHCHHCNKIINFFSSCPECHSQELIPLGLGTERIETVLEKMFPGVGIARIDRDNTRKKNAFNEILEKIHEGKVQIFIGTQMLAKGHHFPKVTLAAIVDVDYGFFSSELRAQERIGQIITQVAGRSGRENLPGEVILQTRHPEHPSLQYIIQHDYAAFAKELLLQRNQVNLPPYSYHVLIRAEAKNVEMLNQFLLAIKSYGQMSFTNKINFLGPLDAPVARIANKQRAQLLLQSSSRKILQKCLDDLSHFIVTLKIAKQMRWSIDVDPQDFY